MNEWQYADGDLVLPWYSKPFLDVLRSWDLYGRRVFEYGSGDGAAWWRAHAGAYACVDDSPEWAAKSGAILATHEDAYVNAVDGFRPDLIVVDGKHRERCIAKAFEVLPVGGDLVVDNADYAWCEAGARILRWNPRHSYPQPNHLHWRTDHWHILTKERPPESIEGCAQNQKERPWV